MLSLRERLLIYFGGPLANLVLCILVAIVIVLFGPVPVILSQEPWYLRVLFAVIGTTVLFIVAVPLTLVILGKMILHPIESIHEASGPIGIISQPAVPHSFIVTLSPLEIALVTIYMLSLAIGTFNLVPLSILDGGRIFRAVFSRFGRFIKIWDWTTGVAFAALIFYLVGGDIFKLLK